MGLVMEDVVATELLSHGCLDVGLGAGDGRSQHIYIYRYIDIRVLVEELGSNNNPK